MTKKDKTLTNKEISNLSYEDWIVYKSNNIDKLLNKYPDYNFEARLELILVFKEILEKEGVKLFLSNGALLGAYREKDFIAWDHDVDLDVLAEEFEPKYKKIKQELIDRGYIVRGIKEYPKTKINVFHAGEKVGILSLYLDEKEDIRYRGSYVWPNRIYRESEKIIFKDIEFNTPKILDYVIHQYGPNWKDPVRKNYLAKSVFKKGEKNMKFSVVASSFGTNCDPYVDSLRNSVKSIYPDCKINIVGKDSPAPEDYIASLRNDIPFVKESPGSLKIICWNQGFKEADTEWVLFMDNDTVLLQSIDHIIKEFEKEKQDFVFTWRHNDHQWINSGVMLVRKCEETLKFFDEYERKMLVDIRQNKNDQDTFIELLNRSELEIKGLLQQNRDTLYNFAKDNINFVSIHCDYLNRSKPYEPWFQGTMIQHFKGVQNTVITKCEKANRYNNFLEKEIFHLPQDKIQNLAHRIEIYKHFTTDELASEVKDIISHYNKNINNYIINYVSNLPENLWQQTRSSYHKKDSGMNEEKAKKCLLEVDTILKSFDLDYYLACGTVLGLHREKTFIEWDDEIDIDMFSEVLVPNLEKLKEVFMGAGYIVRMTPRGKTSKINVFKDGIKIAIGAVYDGGDGNRHNAGLKCPSKFYENYEMLNFCEREFKVPGPIEDYLTYYYGDWKTPVKSYDPEEYINKESGLIK